ncbi:Cytosine deaminase [Serratia marcescens]|nr:hypothetical protein SMKC004_39220 [Serratia marcescens]CAB1220619.1 Cytosine deaminase [Serratia marcescens]
MAKRPLKFIDNLRLSGHEGLWQLAIEQGRIAHLVPQPEGQEWRSDVLDAQGGLALPAFVEPHIHLDTTQTAGQPAWNQSGTLFEGIERWAERKALLTHEDVKQRAWQTLKWQIANGVQYVRTHVDVSDPTLTALRAMLEVKLEVAPWVTLQIVAFPQEGILSYPNGEALLEEALRLGADVVGAIPHFEFTREYGVESLHKAFALAQKYDRLVDVHCDEIDDEQSRFVETVAALALKLEMGAKGHRQPHHGDALLQRRLRLAAVPPAENVRHQLRRQPAGEHSPAGAFRQLPETARRDAGEGDAGGRDQRLLRP